MGNDATREGYWYLDNLFLKEDAQLIELGR
jgi:hypothetical protein